MLPVLETPRFDRTPRYVMLVHLSVEHRRTVRDGSWQPFGALRGPLARDRDQGVAHRSTRPRKTLDWNTQPSACVIY
jgi:hypothetical protein